MPLDLRLLAYLTAAKVLDRLGRLEGAVKNLDDCESMVRRTENAAIKARFHLARSLHFYRAGKYKQCRESIELAASQSTGFADLILAGAIADRRGILASAKYSRKRLSRKEEQLRYEEALDFLLQGLEARLLTENYDVIQASCFNIGNTLYRMGPEHLKEAVEWIELSAKICKSMQVGRYEAIAEIMLAKFAYDSGKYKLFLRWLSEAERIVEQADNALDRFRCFGLRALDAQRQGNLKATKQFLVQARRLYFEKPEFDWGYWDSYFERHFPEVWPNVVKEFAAYNLRLRDHVR
jgi:tetratricopeptide (TPR) repeat protein